MVAQGLVIAAVSVALCACAASPSPQRASVQNAVYMVGDSAPRLNTNAADPVESQGEYSVVKRLYWFFAGR
jgi:hypothetical protein